MGKKKLIKLLTEETDDGFLGGGFKSFFRKGKRNLKQIRMNHRPLIRSYYRITLGIGLFLIGFSFLTAYLGQINPAIILLVEAPYFFVIWMVVYSQLGSVRRSTLDQPYQTFLWPNAITLIRLLSIPIIIIGALQVSYQTSPKAYIFFILVLIIVSSDMVDGFLSRILHQGSKLGVVMDPITDTLFYSFITMAFVIDGAIPIWLFIIMLVRYILFIMVGGFIFFFVKLFVVKSTLLGKINGLFLSTLIFLIIGQKTIHPDWLSPQVMEISFLATGAIALLNIFYLFNRALEILSSKDKKEY